MANNQNISRRTFMTGAGAAAVAASVAAAAPAAFAAETTSGQAQPAADDGLLYTASVNPQRSDYRGSTKELSTLFSPWKLGKLELGNRICKSAAGSATYLNGLTDELFEYYLNFAKGGVQMIWMENVAALEPSPETGQIADEALEFGRRLTGALAEYGAHLGYQWAPFGVDVSEETMTVDQIHAIQDSGVAIAQGLQAMGFDAIEMNAAGFNQGEKFLSRYHNTRTDEYGAASIENRARFVTEWIGKVKEACGVDFPVQILIDCIEDNDNLDNAVRGGINKLTDGDPVEEGWAVKADTIDELAGLIDVPAKELVQTVETWNESCKKGIDVQFYRSPDWLTPIVTGPFYAIRMEPEFINTDGGPVRDAHARVIDREGKPIPGLYSAGEFGSVWCNMYQGGGNLSECVQFARIAVEDMLGL